MKKTCIVLLLSFVIFSCGSRKKETQSTSESIKENDTTSIVTKEVKKTDSDLNLKTKIVTTEDLKTKSVTITTTDEPIDSTKPAYIVENDGKKTELGNLKRTKTERSDLTDLKTKNDIEQVKNEKVQEIEDKEAKIQHREQKESKKESEYLKVERKQSYWFLLWFFLLIPLRWLYLKIKPLLL